MSETFEDRLEILELLEEAEERDNLRLSREERDHVAGHALDWIEQWALSLAASVRPGIGAPSASTEARKIAALSNLLGDIGWEREGMDGPERNGEGHVSAILGELFPVAQLRPWLEEWQHQDDETARICEKAVEANHPAEADRTLREMMAKSREKLGTGAILLARIEKWMASHGN